MKQSLPVVLLLLPLLCGITQQQQQQQQQKKDMSSCGKKEFRCQQQDINATSSCIPILAKCDGMMTCEDGSDESPTLCSAANRTLNVGEAVLVHALLQEGRNIPLFLLCDQPQQQQRPSNCTRLALSIGSPGTVVYWTNHGCNAEGRQCGVAEEQYFWQGAGEMVFHVERRAGEVAVWFEDESDHPVTVPLREGQTLLRVRPWRWSADMPVRFTELKMENTTASTARSTTIEETSAGV